VNHLGVDDEAILRLHDLVVAVVRVRQHRRSGRQERQALVLKTLILGAGEFLLCLDTLTLQRGCGGGQRGIRPSGDP
jgi:hypothetical protein